MTTNYFIAIPQKNTYNHDYNSNFPTSNFQKREMFTICFA